MIDAVSTGTTAFAGWTTTGPVDRAALVAGWADFERQFGGLDSQSPLSYAVAHFFANGGTQAFVARIIDRAIRWSRSCPATSASPRRFFPTSAAEVCSCSMESTSSTSSASLA
jgi:hypothetical protein